MQYRLTGQVTISVYTTVEAETLQEAIEKAKERDLMGIIHNGSESEEECWMADEIDGIPYDIKEEEWF